ncbi:protein TMED8 [Gadus chalcogrammus]|uniref:protein TMED8 n=1 Tax=Gadus chalcogrammus TaxID=1042646 RepID=UPI0024C4374C|nr:protein TMED8 [Gadus chalcogrammus]
METLDTTSALQSRLSSLSVSSFPGITSNQGEDRPIESLQNTDLSQSSGNSVSDSNMDGPSDATDSKDSIDSSHESIPAEQLEGEAEESCPSGTSELSSEMKAPLPTLDPAATWTSVTIKELKATLRTEKDSMVTVYRGDIMTVHVPTVPESKRVCWEFATDGYDIGFGVYFDFTPVTTRNITVHISESSDDEDEEEEVEGPVSSGDVEKGSKILNSSNLGEILPVYRQDSHLLVHGGSHEFPGEGTYQLKFDNSYSLWRNKTLYYRVYYSA